MEQNGDNFSSKPYKRSRWAYVAQCTIEYFIYILISDAFLAKFLTEVGMSDKLTGIVSSVLTLAFLFTLTSVPLARRIKSVKKTALVLCTVSQVIFSSLYFVPFLKTSRSAKSLIIISGIVLAYFLQYSMSPIVYKWGNSFVNPGKRGIFSAKKETVSLMTGLAFSLVFGWIIDKYDSIGNINGGFLLLAFTGLFLSLFDFLSLLTMSADTKTEEEREKMPLKTVLNDLFGSKGFRNIMWLTIIMQVSQYLTLGFLGTYKIKELAFTVGAVQIINIAGCFGRAIVSVPFGKLSDKTSYAKGIEVGLSIFAVGFFACIFTTPKTRFLMIVFTLMYNVSLAGTNQNLSNMVYSYVPKKYFVQALSIKNSIAGACGFLASILGGKIVESIQNNGNTFLGMHIYGQQVLAAVSFVIMVAAVLFDRLIVEKQETLKQ